MIFHSLIGGILYRVITWVLIVAIVGTSSFPVVQHLPQAASAYLGMMQKLGLIEADATSPNGFRSTAPEGMEGLVPTLDANGEPVGFLLNADALQMSQTEFEPESLADPISVSRAQSAYAQTGALSNTLTITFTVTNNRPPAITPDLPVSATITDTIAAVSALDLANDPNALRNVLLADDLLPANAVLVAADPLPDRVPAAGAAGDALAWNLGDVPPLGSVTATLTVAIPAGPYPDFVELDAGATAWGTLQGRMVSAAVAPAGLAPDGFGDWLQWTVDADYYDEYMLRKAAELGNDWQPMFAYVRSLGYESYKGSLRGTRGTLWSAAGNALDQASLLIAMLRGSGIPARYRHGTLSTARAQALILSMFPEPAGVIGHIPAGTEVADPANDPQLLSETTDHWWVEAYLPGSGWTDLDPCFAEALPGQTFHDGLAADGTDQIAEAPDSQRHKVTMTVKVESYHPLNPGNSGLSYSYPLSHTFNTVELVGRPVTLGHLVNTEGQGGAVFYDLKHTYVPYFVVGDWEMAVEGMPFQERKSNFPFGTSLVTGEWLFFDTKDANGVVGHYEREIIDRVGFENRQTGGTLNVGGNINGDPFIRDFEVFTFIIQSSDVPQEGFTNYLQHTTDRVRGLADYYQAMNDSSDNLVFTQETIRSVTETLPHILFSYLLQYAYESNQGLEIWSRLNCTVSYIDSPNITSLDVRLVTTTTVQYMFDLRKNDVRMVVEPKQNPTVKFSLSVIKGLSDGYWEDQLLSMLDETELQTTFHVFQTARENQIPLTAIHAQRLEELESLDISIEAKARIRQAVGQGVIVIVPERSVRIGSTSTIGWWELNEQTGEMLPMMENGLRSGVVCRGLHHFWQWNALQVYSFFGGFVAGLIWGFAYQYAIKMLAALAGLNGNWAVWILQLLSDLWVVKNAICVSPECKAGFMIGENIVKFKVLSGHCPPLIDSYLEFPSLVEFFGSKSSVLQSVHVQASYNGQLAFDLSVPAIAVYPINNGYWDSMATQGFIFSVLSVLVGDLYDENHAIVGNGPMQATSGQFMNATLIQSSSPFISLEGDGKASFYAPALPGLGAGTNWLTYTAELTSTQPYTLELRDAVVTVNNTDVYTGDFTLVTADTTTLTGSGHTAAPNFAPSLSGQAQDARITTGPATGTFLAGGEAVDVSNGVAIAGYTGPLTITEENATQDRVELSGGADFFTLHTAPAASATDPNTPAVFEAVIDANFDDAYTVTVEAPEGWNVELDAAGVVTATPPLGTEPGAYTILVTAQSGAYPDLFASAQHTVNTTAYQGMEMDVAPDPLITIPFGPAEPNAFPGDTNNGQMQIPGAAFTVDITNTSTTSHTFQVTVGGLPEGWLILSGAEGLTRTTVTLPAGGVGQVGVYVSPTVATLPPVGAEYPFDVDVIAVDYPTLQASDSDVFIVPAIAFNHVTANPAALYVAPDTSAAFDLSVRNVGNAGGDFPVLVSAPPTWTVAVPQSPVSVPAGETVAQTIAFTATGASLGDTRMLEIASPAPGTAYTQTAAVFVNVVGACVARAYHASQATQAPEDVTLGQYLSNLAIQLGRWEQDPEDESLRERTVAALNALIAYLRANYPPVDTGDLEALAADPTIAGFCGPLGELEDTLTRIGRRRVAASLRPGYNAALPDHPITYTLALENRGTLTTTYAVQVSGSAGLQITAPSSSFAITLTPGEIYSTPVVAVSAGLGQYALSVQAQAVEDNLVQAQATAGVKVVDAFIRVTDVLADPPFVEVGPNSADLYLSIANVANLYRAGQARVSITSSEGEAVFSNTVPLAIPNGLHWSSHALGSVNVDGWSKGIYTITVQVADDAGLPIPDSLGAGPLVVGEGVVASVAALPEEVAPGDAQVTTVITTERTAAAIGPVEATENIYTFYLPDDTTRNDDYDGFYVVGLRPATDYEVQHFDEASGNWVTVFTDTVVMDDIHLHFTGYLPDNVYRVYADNPLLVVVTSGEGSLVSAATPELKFKGRHFVFMGDYANVLGWSRAVIFALESGTTVSIETRSPGGDWSAPATSVLQADAHWFYEKDTDGTTFVRVTADKDVIVYRASEDNDELDTAMADTGAPYGTTFYFAPVPDWYPKVFVLYNTEPVEANVTIYDIGNPASPAVAWQGTAPPLGGASAVPSRGSYFKIVSDRTISAIGGGVANTQLIPGGDSEDAIWELLETHLGDRYLYQTNLLYSRGSNLVSEYTEFQTGLRGLTDIQTEIPLVDKLSEFIWGGNDFNYLSSAPLTLTLEVFTPTMPSGLYRHEENQGVEYTPSVWTWKNADRASRTYYAESNVTGQTASLDFEGTWVGLGFLTAVDGGQAGIFIDGASYGIVDTYNRFGDVTSVYYDDLPAGSHTISVTVLGTRHAYSTGDWVRLDYVDTWNGAPPQGVFEEDDARVISGGGWSQSASASASGGYYDETLSNGPNVWFGFMGDRVTYRALAFSGGGKVDMLVDGELRARLDLKSSETVTRAYSLDNLGDGPHVLQIRAYRGQATVDAFITPGAPPFYTPPERQGIVRYEEDDAALRYNGAPYEQMPQSWRLRDNVTYSSDGYSVSANVISRTVSLTFTGTWAGLGYVAGADRGNVEVFIDAASQGVVDTYAPSTKAQSRYYDGLAPGEHTMVVEILGTKNPSSSGAEFYFDYFDVWDGAPLPGGWSEEPFAATKDWAVYPNSVASGGYYYHSYGGAMWYAFTDDSATYQAVAFSGGGQVEISIDGITRTVVSLNNPSVITRTFNFTGLVPGPHVLQVRGYSFTDRVTVDAFASPAGTPIALSPAPALPVISRLPGPGRAPGLASPAALAPTNADAGLGRPVPKRQSGGVVETYLTLDGVPLQIITQTGAYSVVLPTGRHTLHIQDPLGNVTLAGVGMADNTSLIWNLSEVPVEAHTGVYSSKFWTFTSNEPLQIRQGGSGNCWIHTMFPYNYGQSYAIDLAHTTPLTGVEVISGTFSTPPLKTTQSGQTTTYEWMYDLIPTELAHTTSFDVNLDGMQAGETRRVSEGTEAHYTTLGGHGRIVIGPRYVSAPHIVAIAPPTRTTNPGGRAQYAVTLYNPGLSAETYTLALTGLPSDWAAGPLTVTVNAGAEAVTPLRLSVPAGATLGDYDFAVVVETSAGGQDSAQARVTAAELVEMTIAPLLHVAGHSEAVTYTLAITNLESVDRAYTLAVDGLAGNDVEAPVAVSVGAASSVTTTLVVTALAPLGQYPFQVSAIYTTSERSVETGANAALAILSESGVRVALDPAVAVAGRGSPAIYTATVTNIGSIEDTYDLSLSVPAGWTAGLNANDRPVDAIALTPYVFNAASLQLLVVPATDTAPGVYTFTVTAVSQSDARAFDVATGTAVISEYGVTVQITPQSTTMDPPGARTWDVSVTNTGQQADTFDLMAGGIVSSTAQFTPNPVALGAGDSTVVQLTAGPLAFALPYAYPFAVTAQSQGDANVFGYDRAKVAFTGFEAVDVGVLPSEQTLTNTYEATCLMVMTNTGNTSTEYVLNASSNPALALALEVNAVYIPPHMAAGILVTAKAGAEGVYTITLQADSATPDSMVSDSVETTLILVTANVAPQFTSVPITAAVEGAPYTYAATAYDANGDALTLTAPTLPGWLTLTDHGDGTATLAGTPGASDLGEHAVTLRVFDGPPFPNGALSADQLFTITVVAAGTNVAPQFTSVPITAAVEGAPYTYAATAYDADGDALTLTAPTLPGWLTLTDHGDGTATLAGTPGASDLGEHAVTLRVFDGPPFPNGALSADQPFTITVVDSATNVAPQFTSVPITAAVQDTLYTYVATTFDANGDALTLTAPTLPGWLALTDHGDGTATLTGTPGAADLGVHPVVLRVTDGPPFPNGALSATQAFTITVTAEGLPRLFLPIILR